MSLERLGVGIYKTACSADTEHFGELVAPCLEDGDVLQIKGQAVSFEALADYIKAFEQDRDFFPQGPVLKSSSVDKDIVSFQLSLHL